MPPDTDQKRALSKRLATPSLEFTAAVSELTDAQLDAPFPDESYRRVFPTIRHALTQVLVGHTANHIGQVFRLASRDGSPTDEPAV